MLFLAYKDALLSLEGWKIHTEESALLQTNGRKKKKNVTLLLPAKIEWGAKTSIIPRMKQGTSTLQHPRDGVSVETKWGVRILIPVK